MTEEATSRQPVSSPAARGQALRMDAPEPGSYWRLREGFGGRHDERCQASSMDAGTVLMLEEIKLADGSHHAYVFAPHPGWDKNQQVKQTFHADDLYLYWEPATDGEAVRAAELQALLVQMEETKAQMLAPPPDAVPAGQLAHDPSATTGEPGQALATKSTIDAMEAHVARVQADAEARSTWITKQSNVLARQGGAMARFHGERAAAALARANAQLDGVKGILQTVANLKLYTGDGVDILLLRDGEPAAPDARITVYQELLALDEETLILLDAGGLDHTKVEALADAVADPDLVNRMIPADRGMVLCRFRAGYKEFFKSDDVAAVIANERMNRESQLPRLLVRDGDKLWLVSIDGVLDGLEQLLPSKAEQDGYFSEERWGREPRRITREDIGYADAQRRQMGRLDQYGKVMIALWGLYDRGEILAGSDIPQFSNWLDPDFQTRWMTLVSFDSMIAVARPDFRQWQATHNAALASGAWVAVNLWQALSHRFAPGAYGKSGYSEDRRPIYSPALPQGGQELIARTRSDAGGIYVEVPMRYDGYGDGDRDRIRQVKLYLLERCKSGAERENYGFLVLDRVRSADLDYYLGSRTQRRAYGKYIALFRAARTWATERDANEAALRDALTAAVREAGLPHDPDALDGQLTEALAIARTARRSAEIPPEGTPAWKAYWKGALATLHATLTSHDERVKALEDWAAKHGREPLRLALSGRDRWLAYLAPTEAEALATISGRIAHAAKAVVLFNSDGAQVEVEGMALLRSQRGEQVVHDWPGAAEWLGRTPAHTLSLDQVRKLADLAQEATVPEPGADEDLLQLVADASTFMRKHSKGHVRRMNLVVPIGFARRDETPVFLTARIDVLRWAYAHGGSDVKDAAIKAVDMIYAKPESHIKALEEKEAPEWALFGWHFTEAWRHREDWPAGVVSGAAARVFQQDIIDPTRKSENKDRWSRPTLRVTAVTPSGVALLPWLAELTDGPLE